MRVAHREGNDYCAPVTRNFIWEKVFLDIRDEVNDFCVCEDGGEVEDGDKKERKCGMHEAEFIEGRMDWVVLIGRFTTLPIQPAQKIYYRVVM